LIGEFLGTFLFVLFTIIILESKALYRGDSTLIKVLLIAVAYHFSSRLSFESGGVLNPAIAVGLQLW